MQAIAKLSNEEHEAAEEIDTKHRGTIKKIITIEEGSGTKLLTPTFTHQ